MAIILVVGDEHTDPSPLCSRLREQGYHTLSVEDVASAIDTLHCIRANALVLDVARLDGNAGTLLAKLRADKLYREMPLIFVGAHGDDQANLRKWAQAGTIVMRHQPLDDVVAHVRSHVEPMSVPYN